MKALIVYSSRTGTTKIVAQKLAALLNCDIDEIKDSKNRQGVMGYLLCGKEAMQKTLPEIQFEKDPFQYDLVIIGTPIWGWNMSSLTRSYLTKNKGKFKKVAYFCTMGGSGDEKTFLAMSEITGLKPAATLSFKTIEVVKNNINEKVKKFIGELTS